MKKKSGSTNGKGKKGKGGWPADNSIAEPTRIRITKALETFRQSIDQVYTFEPNLSHHERALVHQISQKMGMKSKSNGRDAQRRVSIYKKEGKKKKKEKEKENITTLAFSKDTQQILQDLFVQFPPHEQELTNRIPSSPSRHTDTTRLRSKDDTFRKPLMSKEDIAKKLELADSKMKKNLNLSRITEQRSKLPIASFKDTITSTLESHQSTDWELDTEPYLNVEA